MIVMMMMMIMLMMTTMMMNITMMMNMAMMMMMKTIYNLFMMDTSVCSVAFKVFLDESSPSLQEVDRHGKVRPALVVCSVV